jgi:mono/diheme cytochrome c family protein
MRPRLHFRSSASARKALAVLLLSLGAGAGGAVLAGCDRPPSADSVPVWTKDDHHSNDDDKAGQGGPAGMANMANPAQVPQSHGAGQGGGGDVAQLVEITWRQQCTSCHGAMGRGDGQMGPMVQAPDLSRADWQSKVSDAQIATVIKTGRNRMPSFPLPDPVVAGLVARIRAIASR